MNVGHPRLFHGDGFLGGAVGFRRFPEFDSISLGVHDPAEAAVLQLLDLRVDLDALLTQRRHHGVQVFHPVVDHERGGVFSEVRRVRGKDRPDRVPDALPIFAASPGEQGNHPLDGDAEMFAIPSAEGLRILRLEEDAPDSRHPSSARPRGHAPEWVSGTKAVPPSRRSGLAIPAAQPAALRSEKIRRYSRRYRVMRKFLRTRSRPAFPIVFRFAGSRRSWIVRSAHSLTLDTR